MSDTIKYIREEVPDAFVILDAKRGDVGHTSKMYALEAFDRYAADAVTVNPFLGLDCIEPFIEREDRGAIILCKTSNPVRVSCRTCISMETCCSKKWLLKQKNSGRTNRT